MAPIVSTQYTISTPEMSVSSKNISTKCNQINQWFIVPVGVGRGLARPPLNYTGGMAGLMLTSLIIF